MLDLFNSDTATATVIASVVATVSAITAAVITAIFAARVAVKNAERKILIENITQERAKWREKIRTKAIEVQKAAVKGDLVWLAELKLTFATSLHPYDLEDNRILNVIELLKDEKDQGAKLDELSDRISLLLKHDWQRAKQEAEPTKKIEVKRLTLEQLKCARAGCCKK